VARIYILKYNLQAYCSIKTFVGVDGDDFDYDHGVLFQVLELCYFIFSAFLAFVLFSFTVVLFLCLSKFRTVLPEYILLRRLFGFGKFDRLGDNSNLCYTSIKSICDGAGLYPSQVKFILSM
jgi:hypothetical protein